MKRRAIALAMLAAALPLRAADVPQDAGRDVRVQWVDYDPDDVVTVVSRYGHGTTLVLDPDEVIGQPFVAFPEGWTVNVSGHLVNLAPVPAPSAEGAPVEPTADAWRTSLHIPTPSRLYTIDLSLAVPGGTPAAYTVRYRYPDDIARERATQRAAEAEAAETARTAAMLPAPRNVDYEIAGSGPLAQAITPSAVYDDGRLTYFVFPGSIPAVLAVDAAGNESTVRAESLTARPDVVAVDSLHAAFVLRLGDAVVGVYNNALASVPALPGGSRTDSATTQRGPVR